MDYFFAFLAGLFDTFFLPAAVLLESPDSLAGAAAFVSALPFFSGFARVSQEAIDPSALRVIDWRRRVQLLWTTETVQRSFGTAEALK